jgi:non-lysosomal glucosylceramidase
MHYKAPWNRQWPVLRTYDRKHLRRIALPLGGIGTGTVSLGGRADLRDWEVVNRPAKGFTPASGTNPGAFFALWTKDAAGTTVTRVLEGPIDEADYEGGSGCPIHQHNLPRFRASQFAAAYPLGQVFLSDPRVPLQVRLEAFNPLIPADADSSGIPAAILRFVLINRSSKAVEASVCGTMTNFIGADGGPTGVKNWDGSDNLFAKVKDNCNTLRSEHGLHGVFMSSAGLDKQDPAWGTMALATPSRGLITHRTAWANVGWGDSLLDFWDDFSSDGRLDERTTSGANPNQCPKCSLSVSLRVPPRAERAVTFIIAWHFPNRITWTPVQVEDSPTCDSAARYNPNRVGNYYSTRYADAWDAAVRTAHGLRRLEAETLKFVRAFCASSLPAVVKEAALFNLSTLRTQTTFRIESGHLLGWEGCHDRQGCCHGSCTHVWNYEQATAFLFGDLARSMREVEFLYSTDERGLMSFRANLPLERASEWKRAAADGQMGCLMKLYRDWQLSGDDDFLRRLWPKARKAIEFCWVEGGWDADKDGVMEGCQHNTMDVEYYGPNPQMGLWYLGALRAAEEMARHVGDTDFADTCRRLFEGGSAWLDANLFNGYYYEHHIRPPKDASAVAEGLRIGMGAVNLQEPDMQLGAGCLVDQLVGQYLSHICGLGYLVNPAHVRKTLQSIMQFNFRREFYSHFNPMRTFVVGDEQGLLMATYPFGRRPKRPFPYFHEVMSGFEYTAAVGMFYEGMIRSGLRVIKAVRARYDGRKRNPFDEAECGHHYARAMASWAAVLALTGFHYSGPDGRMSFAARNGRFFWSNGYSWGTVTLSVGKKSVKATLKVLHGELKLSRLCIEGAGDKTFPGRRTLRAGGRLTCTIDKQQAAAQNPRTMYA